MNMKVDNSHIEIALIGCGGLAVEVAEYIKSQQNFNKAKIKYVVSDTFDRISDINKITGSRSTCTKELHDIVGISNLKFVICVGDPIKRSMIRSQVLHAGGALATVAHNSAVICSGAKIGVGSIIGPMCVLSPFAKIGENCLINTRATIGHDTVLGNNVVIAPHALLNGTVTCLENTLIASHCTIYPNVKIGSHCKIAAGTIIKNDVPDGFLMTGEPARGRKMFTVE